MTIDQGRKIQPDTVEAYCLIKSLLTVRCMSYISLKHEKNLISRPMQRQYISEFYTIVRDGHREKKKPEVKI